MSCYLTKKSQNDVVTYPEDVSL